MPIQAIKKIDGPTANKEADSFYRSVPKTSPSSILKSPTSTLERGEMGGGGRSAPSLGRGDDTAAAAPAAVITVRRPSLDPAKESRISHIKTKSLERLKKDTSSPSSSPTEEKVPYWGDAHGRNKPGQDKPSPTGGSSKRKPSFAPPSAPVAASSHIPAPPSPPPPEEVAPPADLKGMRKASLTSVTSSLLEVSKYTTERGKEGIKGASKYMRKGVAALTDFLQGSSSDEEEDKDYSTSTVSKPTDFKHIAHVEHFKSEGGEGVYKGLPKDMERKLKPETKPRKESVISKPTNFKHLVHVKFTGSKLVADGTDNASGTLKSTLGEVLSTYNTLPKPNKYGMSLDKYPAVEVTGFESEIPYILVKLRELLLSTGGVDEEGIFRLSPSSSAFNTCNEDVECDIFENCVDPHVIARLIKVFFRDLNPCLLDGVEVPQLEAIAVDSIDNFWDNVNKTFKPQVRDVLVFLIDILTTITKNSDVNKMVPQNLAVCVAPNLYHDSETNPLKVMQRQDSLRLFLDTGIQWRKVYS